jgi:hypothetical protein
MFLSAKESLGCVTKLRRCSGIIEPAAGVVYGHRERESSMHEVLEPLDLIGRKGDPLRPLDPEKVPEGYPRSLSGVRLSGKSGER